MNIHDQISRALSFAGSQKALALIAGVTQPAVSGWVTGRKQPSVLSAIRIEAATGGLVTRSDLRPDIWPPEQKQEHPDQGAA